MRNLFIFALAVALAVCSLFTLSGCEKSVEVYTKYEITAEYVPENNTLTGVMKVTFNNTTDNEISQLKFNLYPNAYREDALYKAVAPAYQKQAYYDGESFGEIVVSSVIGGAAWGIAGEDKNILCVELERSLFHGEKVVVDIGFSTKLAKVEHRIGVTRRGVNFGFFYPILCGFKDGDFFECVSYSDGDPFFADCAEYRLTIVLPREYVVAGGGQIIAEKGLESKKEYTMYATNARELAVFASEKFAVEKVRAGEKTLKYYYFDGLTTAENAARRLAFVKDCFTFYSEAFGEYPYAEFSVIEGDFCYLGMEYSGAALVARGLEEGEFLRVAAHETAHQWWYAAVGSDQTLDAWQDEGLAEFSAALFFDARAEYGITRAGIAEAALKNYRAFAKVYGGAFGAVDGRMTRNLGEYLSEYEYRSISYDKGVVLFDSVYRSVGKKRFLKAVQIYYRENLFQMAKPQHLIGAFERAGADIGGLVEGFLSGKGVV
jgi:hypothetical protein